MSALPPSREQSPDIWWSPQWGVIWSDGRAYFRADGERVAEFFHLPAHAQRRVLRSTQCWCEDVA